MSLIRERCRLCSSVTRKKKSVGYKEEGVTSGTKGRCGVCHKIRVSEVSEANT